MFVAVVLAVVVTLVVGAVAVLLWRRRRPVADEVIDLRERLGGHVDLDDRRVEAELGLDR